ncbi:MAG: hypothetical protein ACTJHL_06555 [Neisseriaceae bacterium]
MCERHGQMGHSLLSLLLGLVLSLALLLLWQRLLLRSHATGAAQAQRVQAQAELAWLYDQIQQDFQAQPQGPCVLPLDHAVASTPQSLSLMPQRWVTPILASQGFGPPTDHALTRVSVAATPELLGYLAEPRHYDWTLSRCDVAWSFEPRQWVQDRDRLILTLPHAWALGPHGAKQAELLTLAVSEPVRYELGVTGVVRYLLRQPDRLAQQATQVTVFQVQPWQRLGCGAERPLHRFQPSSLAVADLTFYVLHLGWQAMARQPEFGVSLTLMPVAAQGC